MNVQSANPTANSRSGSTYSSGSEAATISKEFITLLSAQLMNQDPTSPMESHEVTAQLAQIASLEQQEGTNTLMQGLIGMVGTLGNYTALNTVGKEATVVLDEFKFSGTENLNGELILDNANESGDFKVEIKDESGLVIKEIDVKVENGKASWEWDGTNSKGEKVVEGNYKISAYQEVQNGDKIDKVDVPVTTTSTIKSINFLNGMMLMENGTEVPFGNILSVGTEDDAEAKPETEA
ncbi:hypothetical protein OTK49_00245 [Vibrio coralliirubri]|uniref:flagellar hook assembly protein FlgD n=1 Tax=Vibrio coralliirubri TaxID=1516159 RepID=UPI002283552F|nr:flagellar hook capping FlgD N-terminal domain-containing protein [Vibrio coralliirubri]MCY9860970.1 hypothetical protein [Vibrio coralliirubri]